MAMKKTSTILFLVVSLIVSYLYGIAPNISLGIGNNNEPTLGIITIPIGGLIVALLFLPISKFIFANKFGFKLENWKQHKINLLIISIPVIMTIIFNVATSISLNMIINKLPSGQIIVGIISSFIAALLVGFIEEIISRGAVFNALKKLLSNSRHGVLLASIISSIIFGVSHFMNLLSGSDFVYTLYQVIYAFAIGLCLSFIYFITRSLIIPIIAHTLVDWSDFFFNMSGQPDLQNISYVPIILTVVYLLTAIMLYKRNSNIFLHSK